MAINDDDLFDYFVLMASFISLDNRDIFHFVWNTIAAAPAQDAVLLQHAQKEPTCVGQQLLAPNVQAYAPQPGTSPWKIYLPTSLLTDIVQWHHLAPGHVGISRLVDTLRIVFILDQLQHTCKAEVGRCDPCQRFISGP
jgi:Integrase zinc binding domain